MEQLFHNSAEFLTTTDSQRVPKTMVNTSFEIVNYNHIPKVLASIHLQRLAASPTAQNFEKHLLSSVL